MQKRRRGSRVQAIAVLGMLALAGIPARADGPKCTFTMTNVSFRDVDPAGAQAAQATGTFTYACTGDSREILRICPSFGVNGSPRFLTDKAGNKLLFDLYSDEGMATVWGTWFGQVKGPTIDIPLGRSERALGSALVYGRIEPGQHVPPGNYQLSQTGNNTSIDYGYASKGSCEAIIRSNFLRTPFTVYATVKPGSANASLPPQTANHAQPSSASDDHGQKSGGGLLGLLVANAQYQQARQNGASDAQLAAMSDAAGVDRGAPRGNSEKAAGARDSAHYGHRPLCKMGDSGVELQSDGSWAGPNCMATDGLGKPVHPEDEPASQEAQDAQQRRADFIESHACMTTAGADKANELSEQCNKVTRGTHAGCNIQENTCEEIRSVIQKGCWGMAAEAPDFCLKYR